MLNEIRKSFSVTCNKNLQNYFYNIEKNNDGDYTFQRLDSKDESMGEKQYKRKFYLSNSIQEGNDLLLVSLSGKKVVINRYTLGTHNLKIQKGIANISYDIIIPEDESELEFSFKDNSKKTVCIFDVESKQEVVPACFYNKYDKKVKGKFKLNANRKYIVVNYK